MSEKKVEVSQADLDRAEKILLQRAEKEEEDSLDPYSQQAQRITEREEKERKRREKQQQRYDEMQSKFAKASFWSTHLIFAIALTFILVVAYNNDAFSGSNLEKGGSLLSQMFSLQNLKGMSRELTWFSVVYTLYLLARSYNDKLDREEELQRQREKMERGEVESEEEGEEEEGEESKKER